MLLTATEAWVLNNCGPGEEYLLSYEEVVQFRGYRPSYGLKDGRHFRRPIGYTECFHLRLDPFGWYLHWDWFHPDEYPLPHLVYDLLQF